MTTRRKVVLGVALAALLLAAYVGLAVWADERNTRFYQHREAYHPEWE